MRLDDVMPRYDVASAHQIAVYSTPQQAYDAFLRITPAELPLARMLFAVRSLPGKLRRRNPMPAGTSEPMLRQMQRAGFVVLAEEPGREIVIGAIGRFWRLSEPLQRGIDADRFSAPPESGLARAVMNVSIEAGGSGCVVRTETRVALPDDETGRRFRRYWRVVGPGSALVRRDILRAVKKRAENDSSGSSI